MNSNRLKDDPNGLDRGYVRFMQVARRLAGVDLDLVVDIGAAIAGAGLTAIEVSQTGRPGGPIAGAPLWLMALLPVLMGAPLALRRRAPMVMWIAIWAAIALQYGVTGHAPQGLELFVPFAASYSLGAQASLRRSAVGVGVVAVFVLAARQGYGFSGILAFWLAGVLVRARSWAASLTARNAMLQQEAEQAAEAERIRIARELHDIVAHHLSVIVLQAAGARASRNGGETNLEKIENSGRQALAETRRLLGVLRDPGGETGLAPQPGIDELDALAASVRAAGVPVHLVISGNRAVVPAAVDVSVYRIAQESLTNILKHASHACADVTIGCADDAVTIDVTDDGSRQPANPNPTDGHGLAGMRERVAVFGGELRAGPRPGGGFAVHARLPIGDGLAQSAEPS
jgi:signal transduction histidine kinase